MTMRTLSFQAVTESALDVKIGGSGVRSIHKAFHETILPLDLFPKATMDATRDCTVRYER